MENFTTQIYARLMHFDSASAGPISSMSKVSSKDRSFFSDEFVERITFVNIVIICSVVSVFGITTNVVNIIVFIKAGFQETINISLLSIAVSDTWSLVTLLWKAVCFNPLMLQSQLPFLPMEVEMLTAGGPHQMAMNATAWITAFVTFERCICIAFPLKVKRLITVTRTKMYIFVVYILVILCQTPIYYATRLDWKFVPGRNRTLFGLVFIENRELIDTLSFYLANFLSTMASFLTVVICTAILIVKLKQTTKWRQKTTTTDEKMTIPKEVRVIKMVVLVALIFIVSYSPSVILSIFMAKDSEFRITGIYRNDFLVALNFGAVFEAINASVNIFVYYHMSSKYKDFYKSLMCGMRVKKLGTH